VSSLIKQMAQHLDCITSFTRLMMFRKHDKRYGYANNKTQR